MDIFPIWKSTFYETEADSVKFRIMKWGTDEICRATAVRLPDDELLRIGLNKPCQNYLDSKIDVSETGATASNAYAEFSLQVWNESNLSWIGVYDFAFVNDWSYSEHEETGSFSEPINGHASPGQLLPYSICVTSTTTVCYNEVEFNMPFINVSPSAVTFDVSGGTISVVVSSNSNWTIYSIPRGFSVSQTEGQSGDTIISVSKDENPLFKTLEGVFRFRAKNKYGADTATLDVTQAANTPWLNVTSGDGEVFDGHRAQWNITYQTNVPSPYYVMSNGVTGYTSGGHLSVRIPGSISGETYIVYFYSEPNGVLLDTASCEQQGTNEYFTILSGNGQLFGGEGGTWVVTYDTNIPNVYYEFSGGETGYTNDGSLSITIPRNANDTSYTIRFYNGDIVYMATASATQSDQEMYFNIRFLCDGEFSIYRGYSSSAETIYYSHDMVNWTLLNMNNKPRDYVFTGHTGDVIYFKGNNSSYSDTKFRRCTGCVGYTANGNIMSLVYGDNFRDKYELPSVGTFYGLFGSDGYGEGIISAEFLRLPATSLTESCYATMFLNCVNLEAAPALPATILAEGCYSNLFAGCSSLTTAPSLPAMEMERSCYSWMFSEAGITSAPALPATILAEGCYTGMFAKTQIVSAPLLNATTAPRSCYKSMFKECTNLVNVQAVLPAMELGDGSYESMFEGCYSLVTAPELPASSGTINYKRMFADCVSLVNAPSSLPYGLSVESVITNYTEMFAGCTSLERSPEIGSGRWETWAHNMDSMFYRCTSLNYVKCLVTGFGITFTGWLNGVNGQEGTFVKATSATWSEGNSGIPGDWIIVNA